MSIIILDASGRIRTHPDASGRIRMILDALETIAGIEFVYDQSAMIKQKDLAMNVGCPYLNLQCGGVWIALRYLRLKNLNRQHETRLFLINIVEQLQGIGISWTCHEPLDLVTTQANPPTGRPDF